MCNFPSCVTFIWFPWCAGVHTKPYGAPLSLEAALPGLLTPPTAGVALDAPVAVHRLDARVAGLVVIAKTRRAAADLSEAFRERRVTKRYRAIVLGAVDERMREVRTSITLPVLALGAHLDYVTCRRAYKRGAHTYVHARYLDLPWVLARCPRRLSPM